MSGHSITRRLAVLFGFLSAVGFLGLGAYLSAALERHFEHMDRAVLEDAAGRVTRVIGQSLDAAGGASEVHARLDSLMAGHGRISLWVGGVGGAPFLAHADVDYPAQAATAVLTSASGSKGGLFTWQAGKSRYRGFATRSPGSGQEPPRLDVVVAINIDEHERFMALFRRALWAAVAGAITLSVALGVAIARGGMRPVRKFADHARHISTDRLGERIDIRELPVELHELAEAFNDMLARLDDAFRRLSNFSSDIAHELRTPVSNLLTQTQVMLSKRRSPEEYQDVLASNAEELERLGRMVSDMLFLAKADNGLVLPRPEAVDLGAEVKELFEFYEGLAEDKAVSLSLRGQATVEGDRLMLRRAISNLLSNALRHTPQGGRIEVTLRSEAGGVVVRVRNSGTPIEEARQRLLFERFYRADLARARNGDGSGLGLAIVKSIVVAHGGSVEVHGEDDGNSFELRFLSHDGASE